jgi:hypothetical protein
MYRSNRKAVVQVKRFVLVYALEVFVSKLFWITNLWFEVGRENLLVMMAAWWR